MSNLPPPWAAWSAVKMLFVIQGWLQTDQRLITILGLAVWQDDGCPGSRTWALADFAGGILCRSFNRKRQRAYHRRHRFRVDSTRNWSIQRRRC
jgi:hypothetical protein